MNHNDNPLQLGFLGGAFSQIKFLHSLFYTKFSELKMYLSHLITEAINDLIFNTELKDLNYNK